jgi:histidinol phosphatase-like PHP family hydrolase
MRFFSWHNHTGAGPRFSYCADRDLGVNTYLAALDHGPWNGFAITDHGFSLLLPEGGGPWPSQWYHHPELLQSAPAFAAEKTAQYLARIAHYRHEPRLRWGMEVDVACDGRLAMPDDVRTSLDLLIGGVHYLPGEEGPAWYEENLKQIRALLAHKVDLLAHPFRIVAPLGPVPDEIIDETLRLCADANVAVEVNAHRFLPQEPDVLRRAVARGLRIAFSLDAHHTPELGLHTYFTDTVAKSGVKWEDIPFFPRRQVL